MNSLNFFALATVVASINLVARIWPAAPAAPAVVPLLFATILFAGCAALVTMCLWSEMDARFRAVNQQLDELIDRFRVMDEADERRRNSDAEADAKMRRELNL